MSGESLKGREIKRSEIDDIVKKIEATGLVDHCIDFKVCGSYRREQPVSGDIDIVLIPKKSYLDWFKKADCEKRYGYFCNSMLIDDVQVSFFNANKNNYWCQVMLWTGSATFNTYIKSAFLDEGFFFSTYGLFKDNQILTGIKSEEDIFNLIQHPIIPPPEREFGFKKIKKIIKDRSPEWTR